MMRSVYRIGVLAAFVLGTVAAPAFAGSVTVGRFYTELAKAKRLTSVDAPSAEADLRHAGVDLPKLALDKSLTEGDMTSISNALGVAVTTHRPSQLVSETQMNTYMSSFGSQLFSSGGKTSLPTIYNPFAPSGGSGKGLKKGHHKSSSEPG
jgi:hypothetical protein